MRVHPVGNQGWHLLVLAQLGHVRQSGVGGMEVGMGGMPDPIETSGSTGGAAKFFGDVESWLNDSDPATREAHRKQARNSVANFANISTTASLTPSPTMVTGGLQHFNQHWRGGSSGWWPRTTPARVNAQMGSAFLSALNTVLTQGKQHLNIRLKWDCRYPDLNAVEYFWATAVETGSEVWIEIISPRAPRGVDPASGRPNYGFNATSNLEEGSIGPFTVLGDQQVANYDGTEGRDISFDNGLGEMVVTDGFRESWSFFPIDGPVENGTQVLTGLSYTRDSWRPVPDEDDTFEDEPLHSETGYLLWDARSGLAYRVIALPRGVTLLAVAGDVDVHSTELTFVAVADSSEAFLGGILSNPVLSKYVRTVRFESIMRIVDDGSSFAYEDRAEQHRAEQEFEHTDSNSLSRI